MSPSSTTRFWGPPDKIILRWSDSPSAPAVELPVEIVDENISEPILRVALKISEKTPVTLLGKNYMVNGIVRFCRPDRDSYLITVVTDDIAGEPFERAHFRDPGALVVDDFLTEEEEAKILESLEESSFSAADGRIVDTICRRFVSSVRFGRTCLFSLTQTAKQLLCLPAAI